jgi:tagaturonate reductase
MQSMAVDHAINNIHPFAKSVHSTCGRVLPFFARFPESAIPDTMTDTCSRPQPAINAMTLAALSRESRQSVLQPHPERVIQFGEGNFLRGFADWMIDGLNRQGLFQGRVVVVQPVRHGMARALNAQDGLYTVILRGLQNGEPCEQRGLVSSISRCLDPYESWQQVVAAAVQPSVRFAISNTTEAGIAYLAEPYDGTTSPVSFPAKVTALLLERFRALGATPDSGWVFLPCELIDQNGSKLRDCVLRHAREWHTPEAFIRWLETENHFLNTLVDRIVPGFPAAEAPSLCEALGYEDRLMVTAEIFHLWVIEGSSRFAAELPFHEAGFNVVWTDDMARYRTRKVRVLNGAHTSTVPTAFLAGLRTVGEMMTDATVGPLVSRAVFDEILPALPMDSSAARSYAEAVVERFRNPFIRHELISIMLNCVSKWRVRVLPSLLDSLAATGTLPPALTLSLASIIRFYNGQPGPSNGFVGNLDGHDYPILDDAEVLEYFHAEWALHRSDGDTSRLVGAVLGNKELWGEDLRQVPGLETATTRNLQSLLEIGPLATIHSLS